MFGPTYFGPTYFAPTYFGPGLISEEGGLPGGVFYAEFDRILAQDIEDRDYRIEKRQGKRLAEITPKKLLRELPKEILKEKIAEFRKLDVPAPKARQLLEARAEEIIRQLREKRIEELNRQTLAMILTTVLSDE